MKRSARRRSYRTGRGLRPLAPSRRPTKKGKTLADAKFGILFNSTLAGAEPSNKPPESVDAGARLIVTNLKIEPNTFPHKGFRGADTEFLRCIVVKDPTTRLATGAALSANFPPVFSNAAVDLKTKDGGVDRFWVTDGGASENRGAISMLFVLLKTLEQELAQPAAVRHKPLPIQIVIAEASGVSLDFTQDRGIGSTFGASEKYTSELMIELLTKIDKAHRDLGGTNLDVHFLPMPLVFRCRGGVGTHWKLPAFITLENPDQKPGHKTDTLTLHGKLARQLIMDLHHPDAKPRPAGANDHEKKQAEKAWTWIEAAHAEKRFGRQHREAWEGLVKTFKALYAAKNP